MKVSKTTRRVLMSALVVAVSMGAATGAASAETMSPYASASTSYPAPSYTLKRVSGSEQVVTLAAAKFVVNGEHVSIVDDGGRFLEALPLQVTQGEETVSYTYSLVNNREIEVHSSANARGSALYKSWWKCTLGTVGGAVTGGLVGTAAGGSTGSVIPVAGTVTGAVGGGVIGAIGGGATGAAASC